MKRRITTTRQAVLARAEARERRRKAFQDRADFLMDQLGDPDKYPMGGRRVERVARQIEYFLQGAEYQKAMAEREYAERNPLKLFDRI